LRRSRKVILQSVSAVDASQRARRRLDQVLQWAAGKISTRGRATQSEAFEEIRLFRSSEQDIRSPPVARALARMHEAPERAWTLEGLAQEAGLSRAAFARNFCASVGEPPHSYLTRWRMGIAAQLLTETDFRLRDIASRVGYRSEFSFSRAFKLAQSVSPIQYRRAALNGAQALQV
jgi:AraC-like DNA-binding protein